MFLRERNRFRTPNWGKKIEEKSFIFVFQQPGSYEEKKHKTISKKLTRFARETKAAKTLGKYLSMMLCLFSLQLLTMKNF